MYMIQTAAGGMIYSPAHTNASKSFGAVNPHLTMELNRAGSLSFMLQPSNAQYDNIEVFKTKIIVSQDNQMIFRGRVTDISVDTFLQKTVYVEGDLAYLNDSIQRPYEFEGAVTALFSMLLDQHNAQVDEDKKLLPGNITAVSANETTHVKVADYSDTFSEITTRILDVYGGYLKIRYAAGGVSYLDYLSQYDTGSAQDVEYEKNIVTLDAGSNSTDIFTVLIPLGAAVKGEDGSMQPLNVSSVNGGKDYIEDADGIAKYGRIVRTNTWSHIDDAAELLSKGYEYLTFGITENSTLAIRAVDMHLLDGTIDKIRLGGYVNIQAAPHGITRPEICAKIDIDMISPENTVYTFGEPKRSLTENVVQVLKKMGGGGGGGMGTGLEEEILWLERWAAIYQDESLATIELITGQIDHITGRVSNAEIRLDGTESSVEILADEYTVLDGRISGAESSIKVNAGNIELNSQAINGLDGSITSANLRIDGVESDITAQAKTINLKADKTYVDNLFAKSITTENLSASLSNLSAIKNDSIQGNTGDFETIKAQGVEVNASGGLSIGGLNYSAHSHEISVSDDGTVTFGAVTGTPGNFNIADTKAYKDGVSAAVDGVTLSASGWTGGHNTVSASNGKTKTITLPDFSVSGGTSFNSEHKTTVYFSTPSVEQPLKSVTVDASSVYEVGYAAGLAAADTQAAYNEGWAAARAEVRRVISSTNKQVWIYGPGETVDSSARFWTIGLDVSIASHVHNSVAGTITAQASGSVTVNNIAEITKTASSTINANSGVM